MRYVQPRPLVRAGLTFSIAATAALWAIHGEARVTALLIDQVESPAYDGQIFGEVGQYERLTGRIIGEVDHTDSRNAIIQDIELAPRNTNGKVEYEATFTMLKPKDMDMGNHILLYDVVNRGRHVLPGTLHWDGNPGDGFLFREGYTLLYSGWQGDVVPGGGRETLQVPVAKNPDGSDITGPFLLRFTNASGSTVSTGGGLHGPLSYPQVSLATSDSTLRAHPPQTSAGEPTGPSVTISASDWAWADCRTSPFPGTPDPSRVCLKDGFDPSLAYELTFTVKDPLVLGLGLAGIRDVNSFFRHEAADDSGTANPVAGEIDFAMAFGHSQAGNVVKTFIHLGFNEDEQGRQVLDGANPNIAGRQAPLNFRFSRPGGAASLYEPGSEGVLWWEQWPDTARDRPTAGMLDRCRATNTCPKIIETFSGSEFWGLRMSPGLVGTSADQDIPLPDNVRRYYIAGTTHGGGNGGFSVEQPRGGCMLDNNPNPMKETMRALYVGLRQWVVDGVEPPRSSYPLLRNGRLTLTGIGFPDIPGVPSPEGLVNVVLDYDFGPEFIHNDQTGVITNQPPVIKQVIPTVVPTVDRDGNERSGISTVLHSAPLGSYLGWNVTADGQLCGFSGGYVPFARTRAERMATGDPRRSLEERYPSQDVYVKRVEQAAKKLVRERYLLPEDAARLVQEARESNELPGNPGRGRQ